MYLQTSIVMKKKKNGNIIKNKDEKLEKVEPPNWAEFSDDLVREISSRLCLLSDHARFPAVCKNWLQAVDQYNYDNIVSLPWILDIRGTLDYTDFHLFEPLSSTVKPTLVYRLNFHNAYKIDMITHKCGWIFNSFAVRDCYSTEFLLFSPLTKKEIVLPRLAISRKDYREVVTKTFSTKPDSPDCVFLVLLSNCLSNCFGNYKNIVNVFCHGYKEWKSLEFSGERFSLHNTPVYIDGIFYFVVSHYSKLVSYNVARARWAVESDIDNDFRLYTLFDKAFELNGELMLITVANGRGWGYIRMFDRCNKAWVSLKSLGDHSIFISENSILAPTIAVEGKCNYGVLPNKIYYRNNMAYSVNYSFESGKLITMLDDSEFTKWAKAAGDGGYWFEPPDNLLKRNSLRKFVRKQTMLPVTTEPVVDGTKNVVEALNYQIDPARESSTEDDELENLMVLDQISVRRFKPSRRLTI